METKKSPLVFIVDDSKPCLDIIRYILSKIGYTNSVSFENGEDCIAQLQQNPKVIFLDYNLGKADGLSYLKQIKRLNPHQMVVLLSGQNDVHVAINALKCGAFDYIEKTELNQEKITHVMEKIKWIKKEQDTKRKKGSLKRAVLQISSLSLLAFFKKWA